MEKSSKKSTSLKGNLKSLSSSILSLKLTRKITKIPISLNKGIGRIKPIPGIDDCSDIQEFLDIINAFSHPKKSFLESSPTIIRNSISGSQLNKSKSETLIKKNALIQNGKIHLKSPQILPAVKKNFFRIRKRSSSKIKKIFLSN